MLYRCKTPERDLKIVGYQLGVYSGTATSSCKNFRASVTWAHRYQQHKRTIGTSKMDRLWTLQCSNDISREVLIPVYLPYSYCQQTLNAIVTYSTVHITMSSYDIVMPSELQT